MSKKNNMTVVELVARLDAIRNRVIDERLGFAPRGVPKRLLRAIAKEESIAAMYPTPQGNWLFADGDDTYGKTELNNEVFIAVLAWRLETARVLDRALALEGL